MFNQKSFFTVSICVSLLYSCTKENINYNKEEKIESQSTQSTVINVINARKQHPSYPSQPLTEADAFAMGYQNGCNMRRKNSIEQYHKTLALPGDGSPEWFAYKDGVGSGWVGCNTRGGGGGFSCVREYQNTRGEIIKVNVCDETKPQNEK